MKKQNMLLVVACVAIIGLSFLWSPQGAEYSGADSQAETVIEQVNPDYQPWFHSVYEPASGEIESLLFTLQGSIGAGIIAYFLGYQKGKRSDVSL
ncbi:MULTISPECIES: energy-coupling factor ABC transporter substrate-binding protein [unclassified Streptococcus]|uniref:energy-coupling factor ABC transporter substrate-binding protein n=1 Tax=unclassified Streptococcus TaxID=2608887 RepID=UPI001072704A|nr:MULTISPECIES: energy-coupling factor ABC transporter substrate-binding protein [unclassified Streptococcus]MBF0805571.1 energy-coupling factor ABC transporter substrate-binding protein [Streptococcus sp. 19428wA2_WM07]TFU28939.1 energy-coupling factor ABC transporter substrate-binding protein [Streptococcus sp. WM07]